MTTDDLATAVTESQAREQRALDVMAELLKCVDRRGFSWPSQQHAVREAEALLVEAGRSVR